MHFSPIAQKSFFEGIGRPTYCGCFSRILGQDDWALKHINHIYQPLRSGMIWHKVIFKRSLTGLKSEFSFSQTSCLTKAEEPSLPYYLPIAGGRIIEFIPLPRILVLCEMQSASSRIWTPIAVSISYDVNHTTGTSFETY